MEKGIKEDNLNALRDKFVIDASFISLKPMVSGQLSLIFRTEPASTDKITELLSFYQSRGQLKFSGKPAGISNEIETKAFMEVEVKQQIKEMGTKSIRQRLDAQIYKKWQETAQKQTAEEFARDIYVNIIESIKEL